VSLGCPKNVVDGEVMLGDLVRHGFSVTEDHEDADAVVINTCAFVEDAKAESLEVRRWDPAAAQRGKAGGTACLAAVAAAL
jgi:tRNA A37 methylthiotransferase MiaB